MRERNKVTMSWSQVADNLYQRPLGANETGQVAMIAAERAHAREYIKIHTFAEIAVPKRSSSEVIHAFRTAWKALRLLKSPDIATMFHGEFNQYRVLTERQFDDWLHRTFVVACADTSTADVVREMQLRLEYLPVCYLVPRTTEMDTFAGTIVLFFSHWRTEASGCYRMIGDICDFASDLMTGTAMQTALAAHVRGSETRLLVPTLAEITTTNTPSSPESRARVQKHFEHYYAHLPSVDIALQADSTTPFSHVMLRRHTHTTSTTSAIVAACKGRGITVTAAVHSAYIGAVWDMAAPEKKSRAYASPMPAQVRPRLPPSSSQYRDNGCWNAIQMLMLVVPAAQDFSARATSLREQYALAAQHRWWFEDGAAVAEETNAMATRQPPSSDEVPALPWFTSLGVLDRTVLPRTHGVVDIEKVWGWADPMSVGCVLTMWTFDERLNVQITWNAAYHGEAQMQSMLDAIDVTLAREFDVVITPPEITRVVY